MIGLAVLAMAIASQPPEQNSQNRLQDRNFSIMGFFCDVVGCEATPRRHLGATLQFRGTAYKRAFHKAQHSKAGWQVTVDCDVSHNCLKGCRVVDQPEPSTAETAIALRLLEAVRLSPAAPQQPRAIVVVEYAAGPCAIWMCTPIPPPPPAPQ